MIYLLFEIFFFSLHFFSILGLSPAQTGTGPPPPHFFPRYIRFGMMLKFYGIILFQLLRIGRKRKKCLLGNQHPTLSEYVSSLMNPIPPPRSVICIVPYSFRLYLSHTKHSPNHILLYLFSSPPLGSLTLLAPHWERVVFQTKRNEMPLHHSPNLSIYVCIAIFSFRPSQVWWSSRKGHRRLWKRWESHPRDVLRRKACSHTNKFTGKSSWTRLHPGGPSPQNRSGAACFKQNCARKCVCPNLYCTYIRHLLSKMQYLLPLPHTHTYTYSYQTKTQTITLLKDLKKDSEFVVRLRREERKK